MPCIITIIWRRICWKCGYSWHALWVIKEVSLTNKMLHGCTHFIISYSVADGCVASLWNLKCHFHCCWGYIYWYPPMIICDICSSPLSWNCCTLGAEIKLDSIILIDVSVDTMVLVLVHSWSLSPILFAASGMYASFSWWTTSCIFSELSPFNLTNHVGI